MKTCCTPGTAETRKGSHGEGTLPLSERRSQPAKGSGGEGAEQREHPRRGCGAHAVTVERSMELSFFLLIVSIVPFGEGNGNPLQCSCLENPRDGGAWWAISPWGCKESDTTERLHFLAFYSSFWRRKWQPTRVFLPGESHGQRGLVG